MYKKLDQVTHILNRPDMYVGSLRIHTEKQFLCGPDGKMVEKTFTSSPALVRLFQEVLSNATDHAVRSAECNTIKVELFDNRTLTVWNNGAAIPLEKNAEGDYIPTMIFGQFLTSSNYDDSVDRMVVGRNGLGVKLTNVFSSSFKVEIVDGQGQKYSQEWTHPMVAGKPRFTKTSTKTASVKITWVPQFSLFGVTEYTPDTIALFQKMVYDAAVTTPGAKFYWNGAVLPVRTLPQYVQCYSAPSKDILVLATQECDVAITSSRIDSHISFVNGNPTPDGGVHVEVWRKCVLGALADKLKVTVRVLKPFFRFFVVARLVNPEFSSQNKTKLTHPIPRAQITPSQVSKLLKWEYMDTIRNACSSKETQKLAKQLTHKGLKSVKGLDHANKAGTKESEKCCLVLCEGESAKTFAISGLETGYNGRKGRDYIGVMALMGKCLNVRKASNEAILKNREVTGILTALGLQMGMDYTLPKHFATLNYGQIVLLGDADDDGVHINALVMNLFHVLFPSLLQRKDFLVIMRTPIVKCMWKGKEHEFYSHTAYQKFIQSHPGAKSKYYKGLGTSTRAEAKASFGKRQLVLTYDAGANETLEKVFGSDTQMRKDWLHHAVIQDLPVSDTDAIASVKMSQYIDVELLKFSLADCERSIPHVLDGLKVSQRKILFACIQKNLFFSKESMKVAQLGGYVAALTQYHHGEQNLYDTIVKMAQGFIGSNNIPLLYPDGEFGSRQTGGKNNASPRYIFTKLAEQTRLLFREEDDVLLPRELEEGVEVEPTFYAPILPMVLINGVTAGIGTGWSCSIPCHNPADCVHWIRAKLSGKPLPTLKPWYKGFKGTIERAGDGKYVCEGVVRNNVVTELPVGLWTDTFKSRLETLVENKAIKKFQNHSSCETISFTIDGEASIESLKLRTTLNTTNIVLFNAEGVLHKYSSVDEVLEEFYAYRLGLYEKRKRHQLNVLKQTLVELAEKSRFIQSVVSGALSLQCTELESFLKSKYQTWEKLQDIPIRQFSSSTITRLTQETAKLEEKRRSLKATTPEKIWIQELNLLNV
jgi:DNA topoisomerase II